MREDARFEIASDSDTESTIDGICGDTLTPEEKALRSAEKIHSRRAPPKVGKIYLTGKCINNCAYCGCRCSREEKTGYCLEPRELAELAVAEVESKHSHGTFLSSAIYNNADYTQERLAEAARIMRQELGYHKYLHVKVMPGADPNLIARTGLYADRLSVNIEVAHSSGYQMIAKQKSRELILTPMGDISNQIAAAKYEKRKFATSQTTQLMAGSTGEDDRTIAVLASALYKKYRLRRVYYTAYKYVHDAAGYNLQHTQTPYWRMARLYQADRLMQLYGFSADDVLPQEYNRLEPDIDPKAAWAVRHISMYPVEVNTADFDTLIRIPGIGLTYAKRIIEVRKICTITHDIMKKMHIPLKRCEFFITCDGKYSGGSILDCGLARDVLVTGVNQMTIGDSLGESVEIEGQGREINETTLDL